MLIDFTEYITEHTRDFIGRKWVFTEIDKWLTAIDGSHFMILTGDPGIGKTAIAAQLTRFSTRDETPPADYIHIQRDFLSGFHFCNARNGGWISPESFIRSLSSQLSMRYPEFARALLTDTQIQTHIKQHIEKNLSSAIGMWIENYYAESSEALFNKLIRQPLHALCQSGEVSSPLVILIDGLDEALSYSGRLTIINLLAACEDLPDQVRMLLTSRHKGEVLDYFKSLEPFILYANIEQNRSDISHYIRYRFRTSDKLKKKAGDDDKIEGIISSLEARSSGNFLVISKVLDSIEQGDDVSPDNPDDLPVELEDLYAWFLQRVTQHDLSTWRNLYRPLLGVLTASHESVDALMLSQWIGLKRQQVNDALYDLRELLDPALVERYRIYHESVVDFLTGDNAGPYYLDASEYHRQIAQSYIERFGDKSKANWEDCDQYGLRHIPAHLFRARQNEDLNKLLLDFDWVLAKLESTDVNSLIVDYNYLPDDHTVRLVQNAIRLSSNVIAHDKTQLASQLVGRLLSFEESKIQSMLEQIQAWQGHKWLCPLKSSLTPPGRPLIHTTLLRTFEWFRNWVNALAMTPDGHFVVSASNDQTLKVWDIETGEIVRTLDDHTGWVNAVAVTPDGRFVVLASGDGTLKMLDIETGEIVHTLVGHIGSVNAVAVTLDGRFAISGSDDPTLKIWDIQTGEIVHTRVGHIGSVNAVAVTLDGRFAISVSYNQFDQTLTVWDIETGEIVRTLEGQTSLVNVITMTPDGRFAVSVSGDGTLKVWDIETGEIVRTLEGHTHRSNMRVVTPDRRFGVLASGDGTLEVWDIKIGKIVRTLEDHISSVNAVAVTPDGRFVVLASGDGTLKMLDIETGEIVRTLEGHTDSVNAVAVTPDGRFAISASDDRTLKMWDIQTGKIIASFSGDSPLGPCTISPDGRTIIVGGASGIVHFLQLK
jgi:WD40 repeat protein